MGIVADTHVHVYPCHDAAAALRRLAANLDRLGGGASPVACLAERAGDRFFADLCAGSTAVKAAGLRIRTFPEAHALFVEPSGCVGLPLLAGRQIVTAERIEILALVTDEAIPDGLSATDTVQRVADAGGIPVLAWAPGKWFGGRGLVVRDLIERAEPGRLAVGDTTLRPTIWGEPFLMRLARRKGLAVLAGSDPLPFAGDERWIGTYGSLIDGALDAERPASSVRRILATPGAGIRRVGRRGGSFAVLRRLWAHARAQAASKVGKV